MEYTIMLISVAHPPLYPLCFVTLEQTPQDPRWEMTNCSQGFPKDVTTRRHIQDLSPLLL